MPWNKWGLEKVCLGRGKSAKKNVPWKKCVLEKMGLGKSVAWKKCGLEKCALEKSAIFVCIKVPV